ncbi:unnamed protein product [Trichogramma brassicae]|uniref:RNA-directed DNA polymerase n=1 Tax=Trichogramma brassicae TaxID=86971 RepID=A0A6H5I7Y6_9HYME|nr:unnamed protein product [Trichogramma brassicae]
MATIVDFPGATSNRHVRTARLCPPSAPRRRSTRSREGRIQEAARSGHHQAFIEPVGQSTAPRAEAWKHLEDHGRLPLAQRPYSTGSTPSAYHRGLASRERRQGLFGRGSVQGVLPDPGRRRRHLEDGRHDTFRSLRPRTTSAAPTRAPYHLEACEAVRQLGEVPDRTLGGRFRRLPHLRARIRATSSQSRSDRSIPEALRLDTAATLYRHAEFLPPMLASRCRAHVSPHGSSPRTAEKKEKLAWSAQADEAFERIKQAMASAVRSAFYHPGQPLALHTDASNTAIGAALSQRHADDDWTPLGFFSQKLSPTQQRYSTYDRELLAIFEAIKYFQRILEGRSFTIMTDHRPLSFALEQKSDKFSPRQSRQLDFISRFDAKIVYTPGDENPVADALSRIDAITMPTTLNSAQISAEQQKDEQLTHLRGKAKLKLHDVVIDGLSLVCVEQRDGLKPYLPESLRRQAFDTAHTLSHPSGRATVKRVALLYFWPSMSKDIVRWAKAMRTLPAISKVHRHNRAELGNFVTPDGRFDHVHIDIVKMPLHQGFQNCLTMIDRYTRWPQAIPIGDMSAQTGAQFEGKLLSLSYASSSVQSTSTPARTILRQIAWSNACIELSKRALKCSPETPWTLALPGVLLGLRTTFKEDLQASPSGDGFRHVATHTRGVRRTTRTGQKTSPSEFVSALRRLFQAIRPVPASRHVQHRPFVFKDLATSDYVFRRLDTILKPLEQPYTGPHRVIRRINERNFCRRRKWRRQDALYRSAQASLPGCRRQRSITGNTGAANYHAAFINTESHLFTPCANCPVH